MYGLVSKLFRAYGLYNEGFIIAKGIDDRVSKLFRAYGLYNKIYGACWNGYC